MTTPVIREATRADLPALLSLWRVLEQVQGPLRALPPPPDAEDRVAGSLRGAIEDPGGCILVAEAGGRVVVETAWRGRGVARAFVANRYARARGIGWLSAKIFSANAQAIGFWDRAGFDAVYEQRVRRID